MMTYAIPLAAFLQVKAAPAVYGSISVVSSGAAGWIIAGGVTGIIVAAVAVVTLVLSIAASNARKKTLYRAEMATAKAEGRAEVQEDLRAAERDIDTAAADALAWRTYALQLLAGNHAAPPPPPPPVRRRRSAPTLAPVPPPAEEEEDQ